MEWPDLIWTQYLVEVQRERRLKEWQRMIDSNKAGAMEGGYCE